ncbi:hypothetical protein ACH347_10710 [Saccharopolyspora sp. 5N102]|uniref:hypothetical protein n=1 Tax=Saccharopolyspora sp. 5N102 TaxID=3375155 RepID=UPI0037A4F612
MIKFRSAAYAAVPACGADSGRRRQFVTAAYLELVNFQPFPEWVRKNLAPGDMVWTGAHEDVDRQTSPI